MFFNNLRIDYKTIYNIQTQIQIPSIARKPSGTQRRLLAESSRVLSNHWVARGDGRIQGIYHYISGKRSYTPTSHGVSLICHSRRSDLGFLKWLFNLFQMLKKTNIVGHLVAHLLQYLQAHSHTRVFIPCGNRFCPDTGIAFLKAHLRSDHRINLVNGLMISVNSSRKLACVPVVPLEPEA